MRTRLVLVAGAVVLGGLGVALPVIASASGGDAPAAAATTTIPTSKPAHSTTRISVPVAVEPGRSTAQAPGTTVPEDTTWAPRPTPQATARPLPATAPGPATSAAPETTPFPDPATTTPPVPATTVPSATTVPTTTTAPSATTVATTAR
ncbi:hypothetical protein [Umezawaea beigongshangensis]|uniref:hypothetical protein n=1 Tax=Umezawaea beigongshangensis TaxID=2780383 RepID=UPI0018F18658|nr:hypothetical protein [Umezawaea beigongshangensis]